MRLLFFLSLALMDFVCSGQSFVGEAVLPAVDRDGFYNILLTPEHSLYFNRGFTNIRIYDEKSKEVPYLLRTEAPHNVTEVFREYSIIEKKQRRNCCTELVLHNPDQRLSNNLQLVVKNADVTKEATLLGSDDKEHWFALNQHLVLTPATSKKATSEMKIVNFPLSNYEYYSLRIDDSTSAPLNILTAGYFEVENEQGRYAEIAAVKHLKADSAKEKKTYLHVYFNGPQTVDKLELKMKGAPFFQRRAMVYVRQTRRVKGGETETYNDPLQEIEINSNKPTSVELSAPKVKELLIVINNQDNPALEVDSFKAYQLNRYLTAWLRGGSTYTLKIGPQDMGAPAYDLAFFKDSIPEHPYEAEIGAVKFYTAEQSAPASTFFTTKAYIWAAVIAVIVILGFMSVRMLNSVNNQQ